MTEHALLEAGRRSCITSGPSGFSVYDPDGRFVQTFPFGQGQEAWALAKRLDSEAGIKPRDAA